jgi:eukaryotic-like serine/threonine-protein kinase
MRIVLTVTAGPHKGHEFTFDRHDTFLVGRSKHAHFQLLAKDKYFSRIHFMMEVNPPQCRLIDMGSHNGTYVNGEKTLTADLKDGDQIRAGHTILRLRVEKEYPTEEPPTTTSFIPEAPAPASRKLPTIPGYALERELGRGAMGVSYLGQRSGDTTLCAVKLVRPTFQGSPQQIADFLRSARSLSQLNHPSIVHLREVGGCESGFYFVSDFVPGLSAAAIAKRDGPLAIARTVNWALQILEGLQYAHKQQIIHRDIKPTNVLIAEIDGKEVAKLADFGVARVYQTAPFSGLSLTTGLLELASFIPPEILFSFQEANPLADQYSVAAVMYHLLTGAAVLDLPREGQRRYSSLLRAQHAPLNEHRADVPPKLVEVIHKALSRTPSQRFADIGAFRKALARAI